MRRLTRSIPIRSVRTFLNRNVNALSSLASRLRTDEPMTKQKHRDTWWHGLVERYLGRYLGICTATSLEASPLRFVVFGRKYGLRVFMECHYRLPVGQLHALRKLESSESNWIVFGFLAIMIDGMSCQPSA